MSGCSHHAGKGIANPNTKCTRVLLHTEHVTLTNEVTQRTHEVGMHNHWPQARQVHRGPVNPRQKVIGDARQNVLGEVYTGWVTLRSTCNVRREADRSLGATTRMEGKGERISLFRRKGLRLRLRIRV
jgi:hypothetical protein